MRNWSLESMLTRCAVVFGLLCVLSSNAIAAEPIRVKVVVVAMFESGGDTGDRPGEFQFWVEREKLERVLPFPGGSRPLRLSNDESVLGVVTGVGIANAASTILALGLDPRFDFSRAYWIVAGTAGVDPNDASLGSAAWANYVVGDDLAREIDSREAPADWPYGRRPTFQATQANQSNYRVHQLNASLVDWAYQLTKDLKLMDTPEAASYRAKYTGLPKAVLPPFVLKGDSLTQSTYWHGKILNQWANDWVRFYTDGQGNYVMTNNEDSGTLTALTRLSNLGRVDIRRVLVLRAGSNYDMQAPGQTAGESASGSAGGGGGIAFESLHRVGSTVLHELLKNWSKWESTIPGSER